MSGCPTRCLGAIVVFTLAACGQSGPAPSPQDPCRASSATYCAINPAVTQASLAQTICRPGWTATIRPGASYTSALKRQQLAALQGRHPDWTTGNTEEDHRLPLELGGHPTAVENLSPEFADAATPAQPFRNHKDDDENAFKRQVCTGKPLARAQAEFVAKWLAPWPDYRQPA